MATLLRQEKSTDFALLRQNYKLKPLKFFGL
nr:MAG TPA: hypothetical protein [Caudoviricetes sp.]